MTTTIKDSSCKPPSTAAPGERLCQLTQAIRQEIARGPSAMKGTHEQYGIRNGHGPGASQPQGKDAMSRATVTIHTVSSDDGVSQQQTQSIPLPARLLIKVQVGSRVQRRHIEVDEDGNIQETRVEASGVGS